MTANSANVGIFRMIELQWLDQVSGKSPLSRPAAGEIEQRQP